MNEHCEMNERSEYQEMIQERWELSAARIREIAGEDSVPEPYRAYFAKTSGFLMQMADLYHEIGEGALQRMSLEELQAQNYSLYEEILPEHYGTSYANPAYAVETLGETHGRILSHLYSELRGEIVYAFEQRLEEMTVLNELFIEVYNVFEEEELPGYRNVQQILYWHYSDYSDLFVEARIRSSVDPGISFATDIVKNADLNDLRYLYHYGESITENELKMARHLNNLPEEVIAKMADTYTEGYRKGFEVAGIDLGKKKTVNIRYRLGFERMIRKAIANFAEMGLEPVIYRAAVSSVNRRGVARIGYYGAVPNPQYDYDHKADDAIYLDKDFVQRKLGVARTTYEKYSDLAAVHAGPACVETFGEHPFMPENKPAAYYLSEKQQKLSVQCATEMSRITNHYIPGDERSFTIIAFPVPEIGEQFPDIFNEVIRINTLDYELYAGIQQTIIETLDKGKYVHIQGANGNRTDLKVHLHTLKDISRETNFENCVADVNIPVGEVFTSPVLAGTTGTLHVKEVYLNELRYENLCLTFTDGMVTDYTCTNFADEDENRRFIRENVFHHHESLPMGEFAIGTNTTAYAVAKKYRIEDKLPILIAEKMGPHFAVGDTCYSWSEDTVVHNPDGREIIARDNEVSILRKEDTSKAYFGCHTDITIPYEELGHITVTERSGETHTIIENGRFVLKGTEELNEIEGFH